MCSTACCEPPFPLKPKQASPFGSGAPLKLGDLVQGHLLWDSAFHHAWLCQELCIVFHSFMLHEQAYDWELMVR